MNNTDIYDLILRYRKLIYEGKNSAEENVDELIKLLDELAYSQHMIQDSFDDNDYPDPPKADYLKIGAVVLNSIHPDGTTCLGSLSYLLPFLCFWLLTLVRL